MNNLLAEIEAAGRARRGDEPEAEEAPQPDLQVPGGGRVGSPTSNVAATKGSEIQAVLAARAAKGCSSNNKGAKPPGPPPSAHGKAGTGGPPPGKTGGAAPPPPSGPGGGATATRSGKGAAPPAGGASTKGGASTSASRPVPSANVPSFQYDGERDVFSFATPSEKEHAHTVTTSEEGVVIVPLAPCIYRLCDFTLARNEPIPRHKAVLKLGVIRAFRRECDAFNAAPKGIEEEEKHPHRFVEFLTSAGLKVTSRPVQVRDLDDFLSALDTNTPELATQRGLLAETRKCSFFPGMGELFRPGTKVVTYPENMQGAPLGATVVQCSYQEETSRASGKVKRTFVLMLEFIVSLGDSLAFVGISEPYSEFDGQEGIKNLRHRPLLLGEDGTSSDQFDTSLMRSLVNRGTLYSSVGINYNYLQYGPDTFFPIPVGGPSMSSAGRVSRPLQASGRIMIDNMRGQLEGHNPTRGADGASVSVREALRVYEQAKRTGGSYPMVSFNVEDVDESQLFACWPMVVGFSFTARCWGKLVLHSATPTEVMSGPSKQPQPTCSWTRRIDFRKEAFEQLVLPAEKKELIRACARYAGKADEDGEVDIISNKGGASIFLLYGPPGCGKTLTAEAIAEMLGKPLYTVTAGDLGITASEVEKTLSQVLQMCSEWNALVLIDEADIFIEARNSSELQRNAVVCVMLRLLEYYNGGLFLTTNRVGNVDPAVSSRITVMLGYDPLNAEGREKVWRNLLGTSASEKIKALTKDEYRHLASYVLNGRQIKNSILLGKALSKERGEPLSLVTLERAVRAVAGEREAAETRTERIHSRESPSAWGSSGVVNFPAAGRLTMSPLEGSFAPH